MEFFVPDPYDVVAWRKAVPGLETLPDFEQWADGGLLMISSVNSRIVLALFRVEPKGNRSQSFSRTPTGICWN